MIEQTTLSIENQNKTGNRLSTPKGFITSNDARKKTEVSLQTLYKLYHQGKVKGRQLFPNSPIYFNENSLDDFLTKKTIYKKEKSNRAKVIPVGYFSTTQVMEKAQLTSGQVYSLLKKGTLKTIQKNKSSPIYYEAQSVENFITKHLKNISDQSENTHHVTKAETINDASVSQTVETPLQLSKIVDLDTLALVYPQLKDFFAESRNSTLREFVIELIKICAVNYKKEAK